MTTQLAQLIDSVKTANNWSDPDVVRNAEKRGHILTKSNISRYRIEEPLISIKGSVVEALAAGLRISTSQVAVAAVESMGIALPSYDIPTIEQAIRLDTELSDRDRQVLLATLGGIRAQGAVHADQPADTATPPTTQPGASGAEDEKTDAYASVMLPISHEDASTKTYAERLGLDDSFLRAYNIKPVKDDKAFEFLWERGYRLEHNGILRAAFAEASNRSQTVSRKWNGNRFWDTLARILGGSAYGSDVPHIDDSPFAIDLQAIKPKSLMDHKSRRGTVRDEDPADAWAARKRDPRFPAEDPDADGVDVPADPEGPEGGA